MKKLRKTFLIFIIILIQSALAITAGIASIYFRSGNVIPQGIMAGEVNIGGLSQSEAAMKVDQYYKKIFNKGNLSISVDGSKKVSLAYSDINLTIDSKQTVDFMHNKGIANSLSNLFRIYLGHQKIVIQPVIKLNESKLRQKLVDFSLKINMKPQNATIIIDDQNLTKKMEINGYELDIANAIQSIIKQISDNPTKQVNFSTYDDYELKQIIPSVKLKDLDGIDHVIAYYSTSVLYPELMQSVKLAANAINGAIIPVNDTFSFIDRLKKQYAGFENDNEGYDQVASTLYAALLGSGITKDAIEREPHGLAVEYIEPGLDADVSGSVGDLKFRNTLNRKIAIYTEVKDSQITVWFVGSYSDKAQDTPLRIEAVQKFEPPVVTTENKELKPGEKVLLSQGKEGMLVKVYRNQELISTDRYEAVETLVQIGPNTNWESSDK